MIDETRQQEADRLLREDRARRARRDMLAAEYVALIGYDPFADDPTLTEDEVERTLAEYYVAAGLSSSRPGPRP